MNPEAGLVAGATGLLLGAAAGAVLQQVGYRTGDECTRPRPPAIAVAAAAATLGLAGTAAGLTHPLEPTLVLTAVFGVMALATAWIDLDVRRVPNLLTGGGALAVLLTAVATGPWTSAARGLLAGGALLVAFGLLTLVSSLGGGDVKLTAAIGVALGFRGWETVLIGVMAGLLLAAGAAVILLLRGRARTSHLPLAAPLAAGALIALVLP